MRSLAILFLLATNCLGIDLSISGPEEGKTGDLVVLSSVGSSADSFSWIIPPELEGKTITCTEQVGFATRDPGKYVFHLYGAEVAESGEVQMMHVSHTVTITGDSGTDPDPDPVDPPPTGDFEDVCKFSANAADAVNDSKYRALLYEELSKGGFGSPVEAAQENVKSRYMAVLSQRSRDESGSDWTGIWYIPVLQKINDLNKEGRISTLADWNAAMSKAIEGLKG